MASKAAQMRVAAVMRSNNADRALVAAITSLRAQEQLVARLRARGESVSAMETLLAGLQRVVVARRIEAEREAVELARLRETPDWKLNGN